VETASLVHEGPPAYRLPVLRSALDRVARLPLIWLAVVFAVAQLADLVTASRVTRELNPIAAALMADPILGLVVKVLLIVFVVAVADVLSERRPSLARLLLLFGSVAGIAGVISNTHLTPFVGA
jgi:hypothetical protein